MKQLTFIKNSNWKSNFLLIMCFTYLIHFFLHFSAITIFLSIITVIVFLTNLHGANIIPRILSALMFVGAFSIALSNKELNLDHLFAFIITNLPLLSLVLLVPLISIPLKVEGIFQSLYFFIKQLKNSEKKLFASISLFQFFIGPILNLGSIRVLHETIKEIKINPKVLAKAYLVGFSTVMIWSPYAVSVSLVLFNLDLKVSDYIMIAFLFASIQLFIGNILFWIWRKSTTQKAIVTSEEIEEADFTISAFHKKRMIYLAIMLIGFMSVIFLLEIITKWPMMYIVSLISVIFPTLWCLFSDKWMEIKSSFKEYYQKSLPCMNNEVVLFIAAGFFGKAIQGTEFSLWIREFLGDLSALSFMLFIISVMGIILVLTFIGINPIVVVSALVTQMDPHLIGTSPIVLALLLLLCWSMSSVFSPVNPLNLVVSGAIHRPGLLVGVRWNGLFVLTMLLFGSIFIYVFHLIIV